MALDEIRIKDLPRAATEADLVAGNFFVMDGDDTPKLEVSTLLKVTAQNALAEKIAPAFDSTKPDDAGGYAYYINDKVIYGGEYYVFINNKGSGPWGASYVRKITMNYDINSLSNVSVDVEQGTLSDNGYETDSTTRLRTGYIVGKGRVVLPTKFFCPRIYHYNLDGSFASYDNLTYPTRTVNYDSGSGLVRLVFGCGYDETIDVSSLPYVHLKKNERDRIDGIDKALFVELPESDFVEGAITTETFGNTTSYTRTIVSGYPYVSAVIDVKRGDLVEITGRGGSSYKLWCWVSSSDNMQWRSTDDLTLSAAVLKSPVDGKLVINVRSDYAYKVRVTGKVGEYVEKVEGRVEQNEKSFRKSLVSETLSGSNLVVDDSTVVDVYASSASSLSVKVENANKLQYPYRNTHDGNGITWTLNADGSVSASGTATNTNNYYIVGSDNSVRMPIKAGTYVLKGGPAVSGTRITVGITGVGEYYAAAGESKSFTVASDTTYYCILKVFNETTLAGSVFKPELTLSGVPLIKFDVHREKTESVDSIKKLVELYDGNNILSASSSFSLDVYRFKFSAGSSVNLRDYCAGDGVTDDTDGIQAALNDAAGGTLFVPAGTYLFNKTLTIPSNTRVVGQGSGSVFQLADSYSLTAVAWRGGNSANKYPYIMTSESSENVVLENFALVGQDSGFVDMNEDGIMVQGTGHKLSRLIVHDINFYPDDFSGRTCLCPAWGIDLYKAHSCIVENVRVYNCGYEDIGTENCDNITIRDSSFGDSVQTRVQVHRSSTNIRIVNNDITHENIAGAYLTLDAPSSYPMSKIFIENNNVYGYMTAVGGGENDVFLIGNRFGSEISRQNTLTTSSNWFIANNHISRHVTLNVDNVVIVGNIIENSLNKTYAITLEGTQESHVAYTGNLVLSGNEINIVE